MEHKVNAGFTMYLRVAPEREQEIRDVLAGFDRNQARLPFANTTTTHFATVTTVAPKLYGSTVLPPMLMFCTSYCGPLEPHLAELVQHCGAGMRKIFAMCEGYVPAVDGASDGALFEFLRTHQNPGDAFYSKMQHLAPADVRNHDALRTKIQRYVDAHEAQLAELTPREIHAKIRDHVEHDPDFAWIDEPFAPSRRAWWILRWRAVMVLAIAGLFGVTLVGSTLGCWLGCAALHPIALGAWIVLGVVLAFVMGLVVSMRIAEFEQEYVAARKPDAFMRELAATQRRPIINEFSLDGPVKPGAYRWLVLRIALWAIARAAEGVPRLYPDGIGIPTVATARWMLSDGGNRILFISNYTNPAEPYVRDFIDTRAGAQRINLSFGFGSGFPLTRWVLWDGAITDPNAFMNAVADHQRPTSFWYGPYTHISIDNIHINQKIREGLVASYPTDDAAQKWLLLL